MWSIVGMLKRAAMGDKSSEVVMALAQWDDLLKKRGAVIAWMGVSQDGKYIFVKTRKLLAKMDKYYKFIERLKGGQS